MSEGKRDLRGTGRRHREGRQQASARDDERTAARHFFRRHAFRHHRDIAAAQGMQFMYLCATFYAPLSFFRRSVQGGRSRCTSSMNIHRDANAKVCVLRPIYSGACPHGSVWCTTRFGACYLFSERDVSAGVTQKRGKHWMGYLDSFILFFFAYNQRASQQTLLYIVCPPFRYLLPFRSSK